jgi:UDP-N-acetyl-D-galactosamine dehydrogenase
MGATFKEDVEDIRNSKVADVVNEFISFGVATEVTDPHASSDELKEEYGFGLVDEIGKGYDAIVVAVNHSKYDHINEDYLKGICNDKAVIVDLKGVLRGKINDLTYWSL